MGNAGRPFGTLKYSSLDELQAGIDNYFGDCDNTGKPYTLTGLAQYLGISRDTLCNYGKTEDYFGAIFAARERCLQYNEERLYDKDGCNGAKFWLTNCTNGLYKDKQEIAIDGKVVLFSGEDALED